MSITRKSVDGDNYYRVWIAAISIAKHSNIKSAKCTTFLQTKNEITFLMKMQTPPRILRRQ